MQQGAPSEGAHKAQATKHQQNEKKSQLKNGWEEPSEISLFLKYLTLTKSIYF